MLKKQQSFQQLQKSILAATHYLYFINIWNYGTDSTEHCRSPMEYETPLPVTPSIFLFKQFSIKWITSILKIRSDL